MGAPVVAYFVVFRPTRTLSEASRNIVRAMEKVGVKRFICESSLGIGKSKGQLGFLLTWLLVPILLRHVFADKEVQAQIIKDSRLDWVIVRPAALTNGPKTGTYNSGFAAGESIRGRISRADVAEFMLAQLASDAYLRKTPGISY